MKCTRCGKEVEALFDIECNCIITDKDNLLFRRSVEGINSICLDCAISIYNMDNEITTNKTNKLTDEDVKKGIL